MLMAGLPSFRGPLIAVLAWGLCTPGSAQIVPFSSGPIPLCDTSTFTADVVGMGWLAPPGTYWSTTLGQLMIDITTDHPQTLRILLTSPQGTELLLSAFNGAGGQNYTGTAFTYGGYPSITTGTAPFTGFWTAQGGGFSAFDGEFADGTWTITVIDTACANGGIGPGGTWTPGWFNGSTANGGFTFSFNGPPPCWGWIPNGSAAICAGGTVDILGFYESSAPGYSYNISSSSGWVADPSAVTQPGTYYIDAFEPWSGCSYWGSFEVTVSTPVSLGADQVVDRCSGTGATDLTILFPLGGATPVWSLDGTPITTATAAAATAPGTYRLIGQNPGGCNDTALVTLNILPAPTLGPDQAVTTCAGATVDLTTLYATGADATTWTLNGTPVADPTTVTTGGTYTLTATNASGCSTLAIVTLNVEPALMLGPDQPVSLCAGSSLDLTTLYATSGLSTAWTVSGSSVPDASAVNAAGVYTLIATDAAGCRDTARVDLTLLPIPFLGADAAITTCAGTAVDLTALYATGADATTWTSNGTPVADPSAVGIEGTYLLTVTNTQGCSATAAVTLDLLAPPALGADASAAICPGAAFDLTAVYSTSGLGTDWRLSGATVADASAVSVPGLYTLVATDASGCRDTAEVALVLAPAPVLDPASALTVCAGTTVDLTTLYATGADATAWTLNGAPVTIPSSVSIGGTYLLTVTNGSGCTATTTVTLDLAPVPFLGADRSATLCAGATYDLTTLYADAGPGSAWTLAGSPVPDPASVSAEGAYQVVTINSAGCTDTATVALTVDPGPSLGTDLAFSLCPWQTVDLSAVLPTAGLSASYLFGGLPVSDPAAVSVPGTYAVTVMNANGCADEALVEIGSRECLCVADFSVDLHCMQEDTRFTLLADSTVLAAHWTFGDAAPASAAIDPEIGFAHAGTVQVTLQATLSCGVVEVRRTLDVEDCADRCNAWMPSAFSPDDDGLNDTWGWYGACEPKDFSLQVFDRWGTVVFASDDPRAAWDGTCKGEPSPPGVYAYHVGYRLPYQEPEDLKGAVTLVK